LHPRPTIGLLTEVIGYQRMQGGDPRHTFRQPTPDQPAAPCGPAARRRDGPRPSRHR
jgi:hypothetical protein